VEIVHDDVKKLRNSSSYIQRSIERFQKCAKTWQQTQWGNISCWGTLVIQRKSVRACVSTVAWVAGFLAQQGYPISTNFQGNF